MREPYILSLIEDRGFLAAAAQIQAKALLKEVAEDVPSYRWSYTPQTIVKNAAIATFDIENLLRDNPTAIEDYASAAREIALVWEALARLEEGVSKHTALLNAAVNYDLAGYQANSICIASRLLQRDLKANLSPVDIMSALFLQRRFLQLVKRAKEYQVEPKTNGHVDINLVRRMGTALSAKAFSSALRYFLAGDGHSLTDAVRLFTYAEEMFASINLVPEANLTRSLRGLLPIMATRSTWNLLLPLGPEIPKWNRYLKLLARGVSQAVFYGRSISELWPSQITAVKQGLLDLSSNKIVRMPTSAGKTRVAELAMVHLLVHNAGARCIYVAPFRALVSEIEQSFLGLLSDLGYRVASVVGSYESDDFEELLLSETDVLVLTPEKLDLLRRARPEFLDSVRLFILDEGHIVHDQSRGTRFEFLLTSLKRRLDKARFIFLSAVISQETLERFAKWFNTSSENILTSNWRPSIQRYAKFEWLGLTGVLRYVPEKNNPLLREFVPGVIKQQTFEYRNPETGRIKRKRFPDTTTKAQVAAELAFKFAELGPVLVFCTIPSFVEAVGRALQSRLELAELTGDSIPAYFTGSQATRSSMLAREWVGNTLLTSMLDLGVGMHYGSLPDPVRNSIETDFRQKRLRVLIATNTLAQGVNLPIRTVIIHSCGRYIDNNYERVSSRDYWNIAGRAGRAGEETDGLIIHIRLSERDEEDFQYYLAHREEVEDTRGSTFQKLIGLALGRITEEGLKADLDPEVLALLVEEGPDATADSILTKVKGSLVEIEASNHPQLLESFNRLMVDIAQGIIERVPDPDFRSIYSSTGLSSTTCEILREYISQNQHITREILGYNEPEQLDKVIDGLLYICLSLPEMQPRRGFAGSQSDLLKKWIQGTEITYLIHEFAPLATSADELGRFIDDLFRYRLPWGVSGFLKIAMKVLGIERDSLPDLIKFLPSMVKFGLPTHIACWAMSCGIPSRQIAIRLAAAFRDESESPFKYQDFLPWIGTLSIDQLINDFGISGPILEDVS